jgi:hypothetical protein
VEEEQDVKGCCVCKIEKELSEFGNLKKAKDGKNYECKECRHSAGKKYREENKEKVKKKREEYKNKNREKINAKERERYQTVEKFSEEYKGRAAKSKKKYLQTDCGKEKRKACDKRYREKNAEKIKIRRAERRKDPYNILTERVRSRFRKIVRRNIIECKESKTKRSRELLGISIEDYKVYLEDLFVDGMNWDNYGEWHIDHRRPIASFDLSKDEEMLECFNYKNTQPLWADDNLKKGSKW